VVDFLFTTIEHFSLAFTAETLEGDTGQSRCFLEGVGHANFRSKRTLLPTNVGVRKLECFCYLTVKTALSYLYLSRYSTRMSQTDRHMDRQNCTIAIGNTHLAVRAVARKIVIWSDFNVHGSLLCNVFLELKNLCKKWYCLTRWWRHHRLNMRSRSLINSWILQ